MAWIDPIILQGEHASLEPLSFEHEPGLQSAVRDGELWKLWYTFIPEPDKMHQEIQRRLNLQSSGVMVPFTVISKKSQKPVGMTTFMNIDAPNRRLEIGSTWYQASAQRTAINTECKLMLLTHAFERLDCIAVEFRTSFFNHQSRRGIERIGAKLDGILRNHTIMPNGTFRDQCVYSIIESEWPGVKAHLTFQLEKK
ncbi:MAG: GNAT family protein [Candidatus Melainabacteria bacterium]|nr:GNAT family protein [Candidatus Melainabacteria bacterium]